jgi:hypothetical protein
VVGILVVAVEGILADEILEIDVGPEDELVVVDYLVAKDYLVAESVEIDL